jgi:hypothetical protein
MLYGIGIIVTGTKKGIDESPHIIIGVGIFFLQVSSWLCQHSLVMHLKNSPRFKYHQTKVQQINLHFSFKLMKRYTLLTVKTPLQPSQKYKYQ